MPLLFALEELLFPNRCVGCARRGTLLCNDCKDMPPAAQPEQTFIMSVFSYHDPRVRALIKQLKYKKARRAADVLALPMANALAEFLSEERFFVGPPPVMLVPVPLTKQRMRERGFNQAELLAKKVQEMLPKKCTVVPLLKKVDDTAPQARIKNKKDRLRNLGTPFRLRRRFAEEKGTIILVDDVATTGATLLACRKTLQKAGYRNIYALTAAH